jgi:hypothetical protein
VAAQLRSGVTVRAVPFSFLTGEAGARLALYSPEQDVVVELPMAAEQMIHRLVDHRGEPPTRPWVPGEVPWLEELFRTGLLVDATDTAGSASEQYGPGHFDEMTTFRQAPHTLARWVDEEDRAILTNHASGRSVSVDARGLLAWILSDRGDGDHLTLTGTDSDSGRGVQHYKARTTNDRRPALTFSNGDWWATTNTTTSTATFTLQPT